MPSYLDFASEYQGMSEDELLRLASEGELVDEAKAALQAELSQRKLTNDAVARFRLEDRRRLAELAIQSKEHRKSVVKFITWTSFDLFGRDYLSVEDRNNDIRVRTKWFTLRGVPIFPIASYRYECKERHVGKARELQERLLNQVPLSWKQVLKTYAKTIGWMILILCAVFAWETFQRGRHN